MKMADQHATTGLQGAQDQEADTTLEAFFAAGRAAAAEPSADFLARVLAEAEEVQAQAMRQAPARPAPGRAGQGIWRGILASLGGWGGAGGLATATVAGLWLGFSGAQATDAAAGTLTDALASYLAEEDAPIDSLELIPDFDSFALAALDSEG